MSPKKQKCAQQIQRDERGRLILNRGPFAKKLILTEEQASELQPLLDDFYIWDKRLRRWMMPCLLLMGPIVLFVSNLVPKEYFVPVTLAPIVIVAPLLLIGQIQFMKTPLHRALRDLHKSAPRV